MFIRVRRLLPCQLNGMGIIRQKNTPARDPITVWKKGENGYYFHKESPGVHTPQINYK